MPAITVFRRKSLSALLLMLLMTLNNGQTQDASYQIGVQLKTVYRPLSGAKATSFAPNSPVTNSILHVGDVLLMVNDVRVENSALAVTEMRKKCGLETAFQVFRQGGTQIHLFTTSIRGATVRPCFGIVVEDATVQHPFLEIAEVISSGTANAAGLRAGDLVLAASGAPPIFGNPKTLIDAIQGHGQKHGTQEPIALTIYRGSESLVVAVPIELRPTVAPTQNAPSNVPVPAFPDVSQAPPTTVEIPEFPDTDPKQSAILTVRKTLRNNGSTISADEDVWTDELMKEVTGFIQHLQKTDRWSPGWTGSTDGLYTDALAAHFKARSAAIQDDPSHAATIAFLKPFFVALDLLKAQGVYVVPSLTPPSQPPTVSGNAGTNNSGGDHTIETSAQGGNTEYGASFLAFANGFALEFGDELLCWYESTSEKSTYFGNFSACQEGARVTLKQAVGKDPMGILIISFIGALASIAGVFTVAMAQSSVKPFSPFLLAFRVECIEGVISMIGEFWTFGEVNFLFLAKFTIAAGIVMGILASWKAHTTK